MPQLPSADAMGLVPADATGRIASAPNAGAAGEAMARTGGAAVRLGGTIADVQDEFATSKAFSQAYIAKAQLDQQFRLNPGDPNTAQARYTAQLQDMWRGASDGIVQPRNRMQANDIFNRFILGRGADMVGMIADQRIQNNAIAGLQQNADAGITAFATASTPEDRHGIAISYSNQVDSMVKSGVLSAEGGLKLKRDFATKSASAYVLSGGTAAEIAKRYAEFNGQELPQPAANENAPVVSSDAYKAAIVKGESGGALAQAKYAGGPAGRYQIDQPTAARWGINYGDLTNPDPAAQARVDAGFERGTAMNSKALTDGLGRPPTPGEIALAHQQGPEGALALLQNPNASAVSAVGQQAVLDNGGTANMTAGEFAQHVEGYYGLPSQAGTAAQPVNYEDQINTMPVGPDSMASRLDSYQLQVLQQQAAQRAHVVTTQGEADLKAQQAQNKAAVDQLEMTAKTQMLMHAQNPSVPGYNLLDFMNSPEAKRDPVSANAAFDSLLAIQDKLNKPETGTAESLKNVQRDMLGVKDRTILQPQLDQNFARGDYSLENYQTLSSIAAGAKDPVRARVEKNSAAFLKDHLPMITHPEDQVTQPELDVQREAAWRFTQDLDAKIAQWKKDGKDPNDLLNYQSKDYFGSADNMKKYVTSYADFVAAEQAAQAAAAGPQPEGFLARAWGWATGGSAPALPAGVPAGSTLVGQTTWGAPVYKLPDGSKMAVGARPASRSAPASTAPTVPLTP